MSSTLKYRPSDGISVGTVASTATVGIPTTSRAWVSGALSNSAKVPDGSLSGTVWLTPLSSVTDSAAPMAGVVNVLNTFG